MHLMDALGIMEYDYHKGIHNLILNGFDMVLKCGPVIPQHAFPQTKPKLLLEVIAAFRPTDWIPVRVGAVYFRPIIETLHSDILLLSESTLASRIFFLSILARY